ncbi:helix-turn-helix domain-containing protein [Lichenihabitans sp. Uapishka_5]|uniref:helix-turn-helix domain-containing protein n=1 Tax=Lichenihabitans sp. Uapishka_5 TaxID=3037302 RepID=UPI0029E7ED1F|nr:helix-turn-helix domain-containing protein [Lichenihabitans sp. Uapishka_5]MDX7950490.1 helix-turn-helix domain-containing protein [Lichenihabitans sp. Uapishka_5]
MAQTVPAGDILYGAPRIARHLGITERQVYTLVEAGRLPHWREGKAILSRRATLSDWVLAREASARKPEGAPA